MISRILANKWGVAATAALLSLWFLTVTRVVHSRFQQDSDGLVVNSMVFASEYGWAERGLLGLKLPGAQMIVDAIQLKQKSDYEPYASQFGLQGHILSAVAPKDAEARYQVYVVERFICAFLFSIVLLALFKSVFFEFGPLPAWLMLIGCCGSPWIAFMAGSVYWMSCLLFAPFVFSWCCYDRYRDSGRLITFYAILLGLFALKFLCGYEYITVVALLPIVRIVYSEVLAGSPWSRILRISGVALVVSMLGFGIAVGFHLIACRAEFGSWQKAKEVIVARMLFRVSNVPDHSLDKPGAQAAPLPPLNSVPETVSIYAMKPTFGPLPLVIELAAILAGIGYYSSRARKRRSDQPKLRALGYASLAAAIATFSWFFLAYNHTAIHAHINPILFFLPLYPVLFILLGASVKAASSNQISLSSD